MTKQAQAEVLIVDGDERSIEKISATLAKHNIRIFAANSAWSAMKALDERDFSAVLSEVALPEVDGLELVRLICHRYATQMPILMAAKPSIASAAAAVRVGAFDYLLKPLEELQLLGAIQESIAAKQQLDKQLQNRRQAQRMEPPRPHSDQQSANTIGRLHDCIQQSGPHIPVNRAQ